MKMAYRRLLFVKEKIENSNDWTATFVSTLLAIVRRPGVRRPVVFLFDFLIVTVGHPPHVHVHACKRYRGVYLRRWYPRRGLF